MIIASFSHFTNSFKCLNAIISNIPAPHTFNTTQRNCQQLLRLTLINQWKLIYSNQLQSARYMHVITIINNNEKKLYALFITPSILLCVCVCMENCGARRLTQFKKIKVITSYESFRVLNVERFRWIQFTHP